MNIEQASATAPHLGGKRRADGPVTADTEPGIFEALSYTGDRLERLEHVLEAQAVEVINQLEYKLAPLLRQQPSKPASEEPPHPTAIGPVGDTSSVVAQQVASAGARADLAGERVLALLRRLEYIAANVDLA